MKNDIVIFSLILLSAAFFSVSCASQAAALVKGGTLIWSDEFEGDALDETKWNIETGTGAQYGLQGWGNNERQFYRPENVVVKNGILYLEARKDNPAADSNKGEFIYTSGKISTGGIMNHDATVKKQIFTVMPGDRIEARVKSSRGLGFWPAFWLIGATSNEYGGHKVRGWPRCGEIDILEIRGGSENRFSSTIHYGPYWPENRAVGEYMLIENGNLADEWNVFGVTWDADVMHFLFNGEIWYTIDLKQLHADDKNYFIKEAFGAKTGFIINLNFAVGGAFIANSLPNDAAFAQSASYEDRCFMIDWVRVYR